MKKLFVSQPMRSLNEKAIICARRRIIDAASELTGEQYEVIDSFIPGRKYDVKHHSVRCLADSIAFLADADAAVLGWGWGDARGCRIEHQICEDYGIPIIDLENALSTAARAERPVLRNALQDLLGRPVEIMEDKQDGKTD